jgi:hypothetical protein
MERTFDKLPKYHIEILLHFGSSRKDIFKRTTGNESLHEIDNDDGVKLWHVQESNYQKYNFTTL